MKNPLKQAGKTLAAIVLAFTIGLNGCSSKVEETGVGDYSCKKYRRSVFLIENDTHYVIKNGDKEASKRVMDKTNYTELYYKNMNLEEATKVLDACETAIKNYKE